MYGKSYKLCVRRENQTPIFHFLQIRDSLVRPRPLHWTLKDALKNNLQNFIEADLPFLVFSLSILDANRHGELGRVYQKR